MDREYMQNNLDSIKEMVVSNEAFTHSKLFKLIKKNRVTVEGIEFLLENFSNMWWVRDTITNFSKISYKDAVKIKFLNVLFDNGLYLNYYKNMTNFFSSSKEIHEFALEQFGIDFYASREELAKKYKEIKEKDRDREISLKSFLATFLTPHLAKAKLFEDNEKRNELLKIFEDLPLFAGMAKMDSIIYRRYINSSLGNIDDIGYLLSSEFYSTPIINLDKHIEFIDRNIQHENFKKRAYLKMFYTLFYDTRNPKLRYINLEKGFKFLLNNCINTLDASFGDGSELVDVITNLRTQKTFSVLKSIIYEDIVCDDRLLNKLKGYCRYDYGKSSLLSALIGSSPVDKIEETYEKLCKAFPGDRRTLHSSIYTVSSSIEDFNVTRKITLDMIEAGIDWNRLVLPLEDLHNEEFLEVVIKETGKMDMLTGGYSDFFMEKLQPALLSDEFINKYKEYIIWEDLSRNKNLTLDFIKKHKEKIRISSLHDSIIKILDEEIIEYFIKNNKASKHYLGNLSSVENISFDFANKYLEILITENYRNLSIGSKGAFKLADFVASLV